MEELGVTKREVPIKDATLLHFRDIGHDPNKLDVTYENAQARERTQTLMDIANQMGGLVVGTGDLSELALGWCTYNGDHMSHYGVNAGVPKSLVRHLVSWYAETTENARVRAALLDVLDTPISPELLPADESGDIAQKTEDLVGPYELHDFFLYHTLRSGFAPKKVLMLARMAFGERYETGVIIKWLDTFYRRFFAQSQALCLPDGVKVGSVCSPRAGLAYAERRLGGARRSASPTRRGLNRSRELKRQNAERSAHACGADLAKHAAGAFRRGLEAMLNGDSIQPKRSAALM